MINGLLRNILDEYLLLVTSIRIELCPNFLSDFWSEDETPLEVFIVPNYNETPLLLSAWRKGLVEFCIRSDLSF